MTVRACMQTVMQCLDELPTAGAALGAQTGWWLAVLATAGLAGWICDGVHVRGFCATEWFGCFQ